MKRAGIAKEDVNEVYMGNVVSAFMGQAPARQAVIFAGLPKSTVCTTINKVCSSGMKSVMLAAQTLQLGQQEVVIGGGMVSREKIDNYLEIPINLIILFSGKHVQRSLLPETR